jgi:hypothetical protein
MKRPKRKVPSKAQILESLRKESDWATIDQIRRLLTLTILAPCGSSMYATAWRIRQAKQNERRVCFHGHNSAA